MTPAPRNDMTALAARLEAAIKLVELWPENRCGGMPKELGAVFMDFLKVRNIAIEAVAALRTAAPASGEVPVAWRDGDQNPTVTPGNHREFLVAIYRASSGKVHSTTGYYLNAYPLDYDEEFEKPTTGWFYLVGEDNNESGCFQDFCLRDGDHLKAWAEIPKWSASPPPTQPGWDEAIEADARRYRRLQILGCGVGGTKQLENGTVSRFSNLDAIIDEDLRIRPSRGEAQPIPLRPAQGERDTKAEEVVLTDAENRALTRALIDSSKLVADLATPAREPDAAVSEDRLHHALSELHAMVMGECPNLLDGERGGAGKLALEIEALIQKGRS